MREYPILEVVYFTGKNAWMVVRTLNAAGEFELVSGFEHDTEAEAQSELDATA